MCFGGLFQQELSALVVFLSVIALGVVASVVILIILLIVLLIVLLSVVLAIVLVTVIILVVHSLSPFIFTVYFFVTAEYLLYAKNA